MDIIDAMDLVDKIYEFGGYSAVQAHFAGVLYEFPDALEQVLNGKTNGVLIKDL